MNHHPTDKKATEPGKEVFEAFRFYAKSGLYLEKSLADKLEAGNAYARYKKKLGKRALGFLTLGVLIASALIYRKQAEIMSSQMTTMQQTLPAVQKQADAAGKAADAAKTSSDISQRQVRAYINLEAEEPPFYAQGDKTFVVANIYFQNSGQSPALRFTSRVGAFFEKYNVPTHCAGASRIPKSVASLKSSESVLSPRGTSVASPYVREDGNELERFKTTDTMCIYGSLFYSDIFGASHETDFCIYFKNGGLWAHCDHGNEMHDYQQDTKQ